MRKVVSFGVERSARRLLSDVDADEVADVPANDGGRRRVGEGLMSRDDPSVWQHMVVTDETNISLAAITEPVFTFETAERGGEPKTKILKKIRRGHKRQFVKWWIDWGKAQFPSAWRGITSADRVCILNALCREMKAQSVRDADIRRVKDLVVLGIITPSADEAMAAKMEATWTVQERQDSTRGLLNWRWGRGLAIGQVR